MRNRCVVRDGEGGKAAHFLLKPRDMGSRTGSKRSAPDVLERAKSHRRFAPIAKAVAWGCLGLFLGYLGGMNAFLQTRWFRSLINFSPEQLRVEYRSAYSILPGKIHADGLSIRGSDGSVEWILAIDTCDFHVQFLDLLHRRFHADHVRGSGLSMRIRLRLKQEEATPRVVAALPPVPGFSDPPYLRIGPPTAPLTDADYRLWSIQLDDVDAQHVREVWVQTLRYAGEMRVRGRWLFRPLRWLEIGPATIDVARLDVSYGLARPLLAEMRGTVETTVHPFDVREPEGLEILRYVSAKISGSGLGDAREVFEQLEPASSWKLTAAKSPVELGLIVDHGLLRPGSRFSAASTETELFSGDRAFFAAVTAELRVEGEGERPVALVDVAGSRLRSTEHGMEVARAASASIRLESPSLDVSRPSLDGMTFSAQLHEAEAPSVAVLHPIFPEGVIAQSGVSHLDGHLDGHLDEATAHGEAEFSVHELTAARGAERVRANVNGVVGLVASLRDGKFDLSGSHVDLDDLTATLGGARLRAPAMGMRAERAVIEQGAAPDVNMDIDLPEIEATDLGDFNSLLPSGSSYRVARGRARWSGGAALRLRDRTITTSGSLVTEGLAMRMGEMEIAGRVAARVSQARYNWGSHSFALSDGDLVLRDLSATIASSRPGVFSAPRVVAHASRLGIASEGRTGKFSIDLPAAQLSDLRALGDILKLRGLVKVAEGAGSVSMHVDADLSSLSGKGSLALVAHDLRVAIGRDTYQGELDVTLQADNRGGDGKTTDFSGSTVAFTSNEALPFDAPFDAWWARASLGEAGLHLADKPWVQATVHVTAENASPLQALLARVTPVPRWVLDAFPTNDLHIDGEIRGTPSSLEARSVVAESSGTSARLEYAKHDADKEGLAFVSSGNLRMGFTLAGPGRKFLLFGAESWFDRQVRLMRARTNGW